MHEMAMTWMMMMSLSLQKQLLVVQDNVALLV
jgi:hypothetical protein